MQQHPTVEIVWSRRGRKRQSGRTELGCLTCGYVIIGYGDKGPCYHGHQHLQAEVLQYGREQKLVSKQNIIISHIQTHTHKYFTCISQCLNNTLPNSLNINRITLLAWQRLSRVTDGRVWGRGGIGYHQNECKDIK